MVEGYSGAAIVLASKRLLDPTMATFELVKAGPILFESTRMARFNGRPDLSYEAGGGSVFAGRPERVGRWATLETAGGPTRARRPLGHSRNRRGPFEQTRSATASHGHRAHVLPFSRTSAEIGTRYDPRVNQLPRRHLPRRDHDFWL